MVFRPAIDNDLCFVLMPFGGPFDGYYEHIIKPAVEAEGLRAQRADEIYGTNPIIQDVWKSIWKARVIIADVSQRNPNVNYELGLCHALGLPTILITRSIDDVPFDYRHRRCVIYDTSEARWEERLAQSIRKTIRAVIAAPDVTDDKSGLPWPYVAAPTPERPTTFGTSGTVTVADPRTTILKGVTAVEAVVSRAYGPRGLNTSFSGEHGPALYINQGAALACNVSSKNPLEQHGIEMARAVAEQVRSEVGDGTKTALLLFHAFLANGHEALVKLGSAHSIPDFVTGMDKAVKAVLLALSTGMKEPTLTDLLGLAETASRSEELATVIVNAIQGAGQYGTVRIERRKRSGPQVDFLEGMRVSSGYLHEGFVNSLQTRECVLVEPRVLIYDGRISAIKEILPILELVKNEGCPLFVIAREVEGEALATLAVNSTKGALPCAAVRAGVGSQSPPALLQDLAIVTGGKVISADLGMTVAATRISALGSSEKIVVSKDDATILGGRGAPAHIYSHLQGLRSELNSATNSLEREKLQERITNLAGRIAVISVGGATAPEEEDQYYRAGSALKAVSFALSEGGWGCGGGIALLQARQSIPTDSLSSVAAQRGSEVVFNSLERPFAALVHSAGGKYPYGESPSGVRLGRQPSEQG